MAKTWSLHGPWHWFFLNRNQYAQACSMPNITLLGVSCTPFWRHGQNMALLRQKHGPRIILKIGSFWIFITMSRVVPCQTSHCWVYPVVLFFRNGQNIALLWPKNGPYMVLKIDPSSILINVPMDVSCQVSLCWVYPLAPFPKNRQNMALLWPKYGPHMVLKISCSWIIINVPREAHAKFHKSGCIP